MVNMKVITLTSLILLLILTACQETNYEPSPEPDQAEIAQTTTHGDETAAPPNIYQPYLGEWQGIQVDLVGVSKIQADTSIDLFLKQATPADLRTYGTIRKAPGGYAEATAFIFGTLLFEINFDVIPNQLIITELDDNRLWRFYDIVRFEADTLVLENQERYEFWCRY